MRENECSLYLQCALNCFSENILKQHTKKKKKNPLSQFAIITIKHSLYTIQYTSIKSKCLYAQCKEEFLDGSSSLSPMIVISFAFRSSSYSHHITQHKLGLSRSEFSKCHSELRTHKKRGEGQRLRKLYSQRIRS